MGRDLTHMLNQTNDMQEKKRVYEMTFILFSLEILVSEKFFILTKSRSLLQQQRQKTPPPRTDLCFFPPPETPSSQEG